MAKIFPDMQHQFCWVHKIANELASPQKKAMQPKERHATES
ncbi:MAG: hypothetical protein ACTS73_06725 [Arsenophonus sp. NEOnobi-MAG3]